MDLATLGIAVDTRAVSGASVDLDKLSASAEKADRAAQKFGVGASNAAQRVERDYDRAVRLANGGLTDHQRRALEAARANDNLGNSMRRVEGTMAAVYTQLRSLIGAYATFATLRAIGGMADQWSDLQSRVANATGSLEAGRAVLDRIATMSARTYSSIQQTTDGWLNQKGALDELGLSTRQQLDLMETLNNSLVISATRGERAQSVMKAWSDAMATGALRTDGLNTIFSNSDRLARALSESLGVSRAELRRMASEGTLTSSKLLGVASQLEATREESDAMAATVSDGWLRINNSLLRFVGSADQAGSASSSLAEELVGISDWIDDNLHLAGVIGDDIAKTIAAMRGFASDIASTYAFIQREINAVRDWFSGLASSVSTFVNEATAFLDLLPTASSEAARLLPEGWADAMRQLHQIISDGVQDVIRTFATIPAAGHAAREALLGGDWSATFAAEQQRFVDLVNNAGSAVGDLLGIHVVLDEVVVESAEAVTELNTALGETPGKATGAATVLSNEMKRALEAFAAQTRSLEQNTEGLQRQITMIDATAGATAAAELRARELARAWDIAREAGLKALPEETKTAIDNAAASVENLTNQIQRLNLERGQDDALRMLDAEARLVGLSAEARKVAIAGLQAEADLRRQNVATTDEWGRAYVRNAQLLAAGRIEIDRQTAAYEKQRDALSNVASTFLDIFTDNSSDGFFDRIMKGLADIGRQFAELGKQRLMENLFGSAGLYTSGFPAPGQRSVAPIGIPLAANQNAPAGISVGAVTALNDNLRQSSRSAMDVAKQFNGLNERADSRVLDSFMQASGTWRNLSARDTAWCAAFANAALVESGQRGTGSNLASSFMNWGTGTNAPKPGDIVVLKPQARGASGHVTFFDGFDANGNVRGFGGNQGNMARTSTYGADQVRAFRTATRDGYVDAVRQITTGQSGVIASSPSMSGAAASAVAGGWGGFGPVAGQGNAQLGMLGRAQQFMQSPLGMGGMNAISAFGAGASSGSPVSGGFSGALGAIGMGLGPAGIIAGGLAGIVGGLFGRSRQRREQRRQQQEQERQQRLQAQQQLDQQLPAILELQDTLLDRASGTLTKERARIESQIKQYQQLAATAKNQAEIDRLKSMQANLDDYMNRLYDQIRLTADSVVQSMMAGRGLEPEFAKAVSAVREQSLSIRNYLADLTAATGSGSSAVVQATEAGRMQLLRQLSGAEEVTEIWMGLDRLSGTAAQLGTELQKLGTNAEEAAASVRDHLNRGIQRMRDDFVRGVADETAEGMGLGYLPQLRALTDRRNTMRADATSLGADPALIDRWFGIQARNILDQAGLLNDEIAPLVRAFPELAGILGDSSAKIERTLGDAENDLRTAYQRVRQFADQLASFRGDIALDRNLSVLGPQERFVEAQNRFREASERAAAGDAVAQGELIGLSRSYLDEARSYYASSEGYFSIFREVDGTLKATEAKVVAELDMATAQHKALLDLNASVLTIPDALRQLNEAMAVRDLAQGQALQAYVQALNPQAAIPSYQQPTVAVTPTAPVPAATTPAPTAPAMVNRSLWNGQTFSNYVGNFQEFNGRTIFVPSGWTAARAWSLHVQQQQAPRGGANGPTYNSGMRLGGIVGGYQSGGVVGNGIWDVDSVLARYEGGGMIALAKGEGVLNAPAMRRPGVRPFMEAANAGRLPSLPQIAMPSLPRVAGADNRELVVELQALRREVQALKAVTAQGAMETAGAVREGNASAREQTMALKRSNAA